MLAQVAGEVQGFIERKTLGGQRVGLYWSKGPCAGPNLVKFIAEGFIEYKDRPHVKTCSIFLVF